MTKIKPCPFCGAKCAEIKSSSIDSECSISRIECRQCFALGPLVYHYSNDEEASLLAYERWNERHEEQPTSEA